LIESTACECSTCTSWEWGGCAAIFVGTRSFERDPVHALNLGCSARLSRSQSISGGGPENKQDRRCFSNSFCWVERGRWVHGLGSDLATRRFLFSLGCKRKWSCFECGDLGLNWNCHPRLASPKWNRKKDWGIGWRSFSKEAFLWSAKAVLKLVRSNPT
jgi:hypothetical protein